MRRSRFEPEVALGIAEAIEVSVTLAQLVTVPVLDARLQELRHEFKADIQVLRGEIHGARAEFKAELATEIGKIRAEFTSELQKLRADLRVEIHAVKSELVRWVFLTMLASVALSTGADAVLKLLTN